jgi:arsenate reductase
MAEALLRHLSGGRVQVFSAGSDPQPHVHPLAKETLEYRYGLETSGLYPKSMNDFLGEPFDYVITVCDRAAEACPVFPGDPERMHWSFDDPAAVAGERAQRRAFASTATGLSARLRLWLSLPDVRRRLADGDSLETPAAVVDAAHDADDA